MSDLANIDQSPRKSTAKPQRILKVTRQVRAAIDAMVWQGLNRQEAADHTGMKDNSLYVALRRPDVKALYLQELDVLRLSERARSIHRQVELRDQDDNKMVAFNAAKELAGSPDAQIGNMGRSIPGLVVVINTNSDTRLTHAQPVTIDNAEISK